MKPEIHLASCETPLQPLKSKIHFISKPAQWTHSLTTSYSVAASSTQTFAWMGVDTNVA